MIVLRLATQSLRNRWLTAMLTITAIAVSIALLLGVEKVRQARDRALPVPSLART
jgi:putative ABC transport system permease protein